MLLLLLVYVCVCVWRGEGAQVCVCVLVWAGGASRRVCYGCVCLSALWWSGLVGRGLGKIRARVCVCAYVLWGGAACWVCVLSSVCRWEGMWVGDAGLRV